MKLQDKRKNVRCFILTVILLFTTRAFDAYTTYIYTSDMSKEGNPIMVALGWKAGIVFQILMCIFLTYCCYKYYTTKIHVSKARLDAKRITLLKFSSLFQYGNTDSFVKNCLVKIPLRKPTIHFFGYASTNTLIFAGILLGISTTLLINFHAYRQFYLQFKIPFVLIGLIIVAFAFFVSKFYKKKYAEFQRENSVNNC
jgi:hypothetical protein